MEKLRRAVKQIAETPISKRRSNLSTFQQSLVPLLSLASSLYSLALRFRNYRFSSCTSRTWLPVPVISVGNLTWGGNGKTPMVEFLARSFSSNEISPLILSRGYGGGDEAKMLKRQLQETSARIGVGANRASVAARFFEQYGYIKFRSVSEKLISEDGKQIIPSDKIGVVILDDGMQHLSLCRDIEVVMVNALMPWGNDKLVPLGPLREPLTALDRADIVIIHHADLVDENDINTLESTIRGVKEYVHIFFTIMAPTHFFPFQDTSCRMSLDVVDNKNVLCLSGIGCADSFIRRIEKMGAAHVDHIDFSDHHVFQLKDIGMVRSRLQELEQNFNSKPIAVVTEKDYDRSPEVLERLKPYEVLVLCCRLQFSANKGTNEDNFMKLITEYLQR